MSKVDEKYQQLMEPARAAYKQAIAVAFAEAYIQDTNKE